MERHALYIDDASWPGVRDATMAAVRLAQSPAEIYAPLRVAVAASAGSRGVFLEAPAPQDSERPCRNRKQRCPSALPKISSSDGIGRITVSSIGPVGTQSASARATAIAEAIGRALSGVTCGWIIDVRDVHSQEDWGLLAGLRGFIRDGEVFDLRDRSGQARRVSIAMNSVLVDGQLMATTDSSGGQPTLPIAVLQSGETSEVGEAVVLALSQDVRTHTFGTSTGGQPLTERFALPDGAEMVLPTAVLTDPAGHDRAQGIPALVETADSERTALEWLRSQCR